MKRAEILIITLLISLSLVFLFALLNVVKPENAGIIIESNPESQVFVNGKSVGKTPYQGYFSKKEVTVYLQPINTQTQLTPFETKVFLEEGVNTIIKRNFGETDEESSGTIISFEKGKSSEMGASIVTTPDNANIIFNGIDMGLSPQKITSPMEGEQEVFVTKNDYEDLGFTIKTVRGYRLTAIIKLKRKLNTLDLRGPKTQDFVEVYKNSAGYVKVKSEPTSKGAEVGKAYPTNKYQLMDTQDVWYKILLEDGTSGWIPSVDATKSSEVSF